MFECKEYVSNPSYEADNPMWIIPTPRVRIDAWNFVDRSSDDPRNNWDEVHPWPGSTWVP